MNNARVKKLVNLAEVGLVLVGRAKQNNTTLFMSFNWINRPLNCVSIISYLLRGVCVFVLFLLRLVIRGRAPMY